MKPKKPQKGLPTTPAAPKGKAPKDNKPISKRPAPKDTKPAVKKGFK